MSDQLPTGSNVFEEHVWERGWQDHEQRQLERLAKLPMSEKLAWLEEAHRLVQQIRASKDRSGDP